jgi:peptidyl-prolyl cis-trans isomerase D
MGTFERIRKTSPYILAAFAIIFVAFMVISDADIKNLISNKTDYRSSVIARVNGEEITLRDFENRVKDAKDAEEAKRRQSGSEDMQIDESELRQKVFNQMIFETLLNQESKKLGLFVSAEEMKDAFIANPPDELKRFFVDSTGKVNRDYYINYLKIITNPDALYDNLPQSWSNDQKKEYVVKFKSDLINIEKNLKAKKLYESYISLISTAATRVSPLFATEIYKNETANADAQYIYLSVHNIKNEDVTVTEADIQKYYDDRKEFFTQRPKRKIKYAVFPVIPSAKDSAKAFDSIQKIAAFFQPLTEIKQRDSMFTKLFGLGDTSGFVAKSTVDQRFVPYMENVPDNQVVGPIMLNDGGYFIRFDGSRTTTIVDSVRASHILIKFDNNKDTAKSRANQILKMAKSGFPFETLAQQYSQDSMSAIKGGDLDYFTKGKMIKPFEDAAFGGKVGDIVGPIESQFGYHIIKVTDRVSHDVDEIKLSKINIHATVSEFTNQQLNKDVNELKKMLDKGELFESSVAKFSTIISADSLTITKGDPAGINGRIQYFASKYLSDKAFESKVGSVLDPVELKRQAWVLVQIVSKSEDKIAPIEDVKPIIYQRLLVSKKIDALKSKAEDIYSKVRGLDSLNKASIPDIEVQSVYGIKEYGAKATTDAERDIAFTTKAMMLPVGEINQPIRGESGYFIMQVTRRTDPVITDIDKQLPNFIQRLTMWSADNLNSQFNDQKTSWEDKIKSSRWFQQIKENGKIEDLRWKYNYTDY